MSEESKTEVQKLYARIEEVKKIISDVQHETLRRDVPLENQKRTEQGEEKELPGMSSPLTVEAPLPFSVVVAVQEKYLNWTPEQTKACAERLAEMPALQTALQDPLTLNLFIQSWVKLEQGGVEFSKLTRVGIYAIFIQHWLTTCQDSIPTAVRQAIQGNSPHLESGLSLLAGTLDFESYQKRLGSTEFKLYADRSFYDYFAARFLLQTSQDSDLNSLVAALNRGNIRDEPALLSFIVECSQQARSPYKEEYILFRQKLLEIIAHSAQDKSNKRWAQASANAATLLSACHEDLTHQSWAGVQLAGADLRHSRLTETNLTGANLQGAQLNLSLLFQVNLQGANLCDVIWSEDPLLQTDKPLSLNGPQLLDTQMSTASRHLLAQYGADVSRVQEIKAVPSSLSPLSASSSPSPSGVGFFENKTPPPASREDVQQVRTQLQNRLRALISKSNDPFWKDQEKAGFWSKKRPVVISQLREALEGDPETVWHRLYGVVTKYIQAADQSVHGASSTSGTSYVPKAGCPYAANSICFQVCELIAMVHQDKRYAQAKDRLSALENTINGKQNYDQRLQTLEKRLANIKTADKTKEKANLLIDMGRLHLEFSEFEKAIASFTKAIELDPAPFVYRLRANLYQQLGRTADALADYERALRGSPANPQSHFDYGHALLLAERPQDAVAAFQEARRLSQLPQPPEYAARAADRVAEIDRILQQLTHSPAMQMTH